MAGPKCLEHRYATDARVVDANGSARVGGCLHVHWVPEFSRAWAENGKLGAQLMVYRFQSTETLRCFKLLTREAKISHA